MGKERCDYKFYRKNKTVYIEVYGSYCPYTVIKWHKFITYITYHIMYLNKNYFYSLPIREDMDLK